MKTMMNFARGARRALPLAALLALSACKAELPDDGMVAANISPYNHTDDYIHELYVDGAWGGNSFPYGGGGSFVCCVMYPRTWRPDLTATVKWTTSCGIPGGFNGAEPVWHEKVVPIERYEKPGTRLNVHFLPGGEVRLLIWNGAAGTPGYAGPNAPEAPPDWPPNTKDCAEATAAKAAASGPATNEGERR